MVRQIKLIIQIILILALFSFFYIYAEKYYEEFKHIEFSINYSALLTSFIFFLFGYLLLIFLWQKVLLLCAGEVISFRCSYVATNLSLLGRYVPGKIWTPLGKIALSVQEGSEKSVLAAVVVIETIIFICAGLSVALSLSSFIFSHYNLNSSIFLFFLIVIFVIVYFKLDLFWSLLNKFLTYKSVSEIPQPNRLRLLVIFFGYILVFLLWGLGTSLYLNSMVEISFDNTLKTIGIFAFSWISGFFVLFAPAGIGIREASFIFGLQQIGIDVSIIVVLALVTRLITLFIEAILGVSALPMYFRNKY